MIELSRGSEAIIFDEHSKVVKNRVKKSYRLDSLDLELRTTRTKREVKILKKLFDSGLNVPEVLSSDKTSFEMEKISGDLLKDVLSTSNYKMYSKKIGLFLSRMHDLNIIHHDLTTSNMLVSGDKLYVIDFGLSFVSTKLEDKAVDLHLLKRALLSKHFDVCDSMFSEVLKHYNCTSSEDVLKRFETVENRGRNKNK